jgi:hypothetical protein
VSGTQRHVWTALTGVVVGAAILSVSVSAAASTSQWKSDARRFVTSDNIAYCEFYVPRLRCTWLRSPTARRPYRRGVVTTLEPKGKPRLAPLHVNLGPSPPSPLHLGFDEVWLATEKATPGSDSRARAASCSAV